MGKSLRSLLFSLLLLSGCGLEGAPTLRLTLPQEVVAQEGEAGRLSVVLEGRRVREVALRVVGLPSPPPPLRVGLASGRAQVELLLEAPPGDHEARVVAEGGGLRREAPFRLRVEARPPLEAFLEGMVYVGQAPGLLPQGAGASLGQIRFCPTGCSGRPLGGGWYRTEGLSPQGASPVFPDRPVRAQGVAEPLFPRQWNLRLARFPEAWTQATGVGVAVAVPDTGVLQGHPDLQGALLPGLDLLEGDTDPEEPPTGSPLQNFHGSHVAGILAAPWQGVGMAGASQAQVLPIRLLTPEGTGRESDLILALRWAAGIPVAGLPPNPHPVRVVNLSLAGEGPCSPALQQALDEVRARGVLVVAAAGNQGRDHRDYFPANCRGVLAVGAVGPDGRLTPYSNRGAPLLAPGGNGALGNEALVLGPTWASGFAYRLLQGTSQAAPHVAGAAALLLALRPDLGPSALEAALLLGAEATPEGRLLRADEALAALEGEGAVLRVEGGLELLPGEEGQVGVEVLSPTPVRVAVLPDPGLAAHLAPNPAQGRAVLRVRAALGLGGGTYRVGLEAGQAQAEVPVRVGGREGRVVLEACPPEGPCLRAVLPGEGGAFRLRATPGPYRLLAFLDGNANGLLDPWEPRGEAEAVAPARGLVLVVR